MTRKVKLDPETDKAMRLARVKEFQKMAQELLDDPETGAAFRRVGVSGDFTPQERDAVYDRFGLGKYYVDENLNVALDYQAVIQALARRVAAGIYSSVYDDEAHAYALSNTFVQDYSVPSSDNAIVKQRISFDDFLVVLREFMAWDELPYYLNVIRNWEFDPHHEEYDYVAQVHELYLPIEHKGTEIFRKYGHVGRFDVQRVARALIEEGKTADDIDAVRDHAMQLISFTLIKGEAK